MNEFVSNDMKEPFTYIGHRLTVSDPNWWKGEPIWVSAEKQGQHTASTSWPVSGFAIQGIKPTYYQEYPEDGDPETRVNQVLSWLDLPQNRRPTLLMAYFENLDNAGHKAGPDSTEVRQAALRIDEAIGQLIKGLKQRGIASQVNLIIVSDHGMSPIDPNKVIDLMNIIPKKDLLAITDSDAVVAVYPKPEKINTVYQALKKASKGMTVYREADIPAKFHFNSSHTPPILCVADEQGYLLGKDKEPQKGTHGYDPQLQSMQAVFIATGPAFKKGYTRAAIQNFNLYSLFARLLHIQPGGNDGSLAAIKDVLKQS
jgi:predicted AlkP superfamily pyrophosphatase or phosphodiesterase